MLVDTLGFLLGISVTEASGLDRDGARDLLRGLLVRDYEVLPEHSVAMAQISMIKLMLARIAR